jgi:hypothetical protein
MAELTHDQLQAIWDFEDAPPDPIPADAIVIDPDLPPADPDNHVDGTNQADVIIGNDNDNVISGAQGNDVLYGLGGDDTLHGNQGSDELWGGAGDDTLHGDQGDDILYGGSGDDKLHGDAGDDILVAGAGNDDLWGGNGDDAFVFRFSVEAGAGESTTVYFRATEDGTGGDTPDANANPQAWLNFLSQLVAWREEMFEIHGADLDDSMDEVELVNKNLDKFLQKYGENLEELASDNDFIDWAGSLLSFDNSYTYVDGNGGDPTIMGEGNNTIHDWSSGSNILHLYGLSDTNGDLNYWGDWLSSEVVDGNTVISWDGGSITLLNVNTTIADLVADELVSFGLPAGHYDINDII